MSFPNERRVISELDCSVRNMQRAIREALNHGTQFTYDFGELYLSAARISGQLEVMACKLTAMEQTK